jgi:hypothetical protein
MFLAFQASTFSSSFAQTDRGYAFFLSKSLKEKLEPADDWQ